jgi:hypothetical protein
MEIIIETVPSKNISEEVNEKIKAIAEDRNPIIAKRFSMNPLDLKVILYRSKSDLAFRVDPNGEHSVFTGYVDGSDEILLVHPENVLPVFGDNLYKEMGVLIDFSLTKMYLCKKYYPRREDFKLFYKYFSIILAKISSGSYSYEIPKFDIKTYSEDKRYRKDQEIGIVLYIMLENSGLDFIFENLDVFMEDMDVKKTVFKLYKKSFSQFVEQIQRKLIEEDKQMQKIFKQGRRSR